ncbi:protein transport protein SEC24 A-like isoform X3 [Nicotiana tomentosiformis]|nr:protein transport protein Sec24-like At3g07100 isoform X3 [Nicotiana tomentosiformis]XP_009629423.1 protein transport protein Sec24-like At3g07100 isoform X3 [Nicotiana tomentosiformis]XP_018634328.1 protein transport protein Sec24-like At3g07100 isoform X3 [Nicotiana tomentosiformis]XP_033508271.1 protein transport protein Sec24-like At3g07100 isoform X3 [Nicotiana tomentosiformis]XP_033508272.1 protein transport protein Sec24-like At3g07100 isoform X3 [Nicotiana tomentosiformis]XP_0335082
MGTEYPNGPAIPSRPVSPFSVPQSSTPFQSSGPVVGSEASAFRHASPSSSQITSLSSASGAMVGTEASAFRTMPSGMPNDAARPPPTSPSPYGPPAAGPYQRFPAPQFSSTAGVPPPRSSLAGQPVLQPPVRPVSGPFSTSHVSLNPQIQPPHVPMGFPPQSASMVQPGPVVPRSPVDSQFSAARATMHPSSPPAGPAYPAARPGFQSAFPGYISYQNTAGAQVQPRQSLAFPSQQGGYVPTMPATSSPYLAQQGGYAAPPSVASQLGNSREQMQHPGSTPPTAVMQGLEEDFSSFSIGSVPGSFDPGLDSKVLPRPLEGDLERNTLSEMYPMNCSLRYLRLTTSGIPNSQSLASRWHLTLGAVVSPLAEAPNGEEVPVVNFARTGIIRCKRCRIYVNPYVTFTDSGRKWRCNLCALLNDVPGEYFAYLDASGRRIDLDQRPELTKGSVEFIAPTDYMVRPPMPPLYFFLIDVSVSAVKSGMLEVVSQTIKSCLDNLPGFPRTQIGFITYDSTLHFYNMKSSLTQPQMIVMSDLDDVFIPLPDDLLVNLSESRTVVDAFLDSLPSMFQENVNVESAFGPALKAAFMVMSQLGGKLLIFQHTLPSLGVGRLRLRGDDLRVYGTDKEHTLRTPEDPFYKQMAADFTKYQVAVNVYGFSDKYTDIATLGTLAKYTGGQVYYYPGFQAAVHKDKLRHELARDLTRETAWESVMRIRCGKGVRSTTYHGNFMLRSTDLMALPAVDCDKAYAMQLSLEETLLTSQTVYFQVALLYTSSSGERRIRVHTTAAPVVSDLGEMYRLADTGAIVSLFTRLAIEKALASKLEEARSFIQLRIVKALREYRDLHAVQHRLGGRMIYPESLKCLPLYGLALCKSIAFRDGHADARLDERCTAGYTMMALPVKTLLKLLYSQLIRVDEYLLKKPSLAEDSIDIWNGLPLAAGSLDPQGLYLYDDGFRFVLWFGRMLSPDILNNLLGENFAADFSKVCLRELDNEMSRKLLGLLNKYRESDRSYYQLSYLVRQGEQPREGYFLLANLIEDAVAGANGYLDWIMQLHRQVQQNA